MKSQNKEGTGVFSRVAPFPAKACGKGWTGWYKILLLVYLCWHKKKKNVYYLFLSSLADSLSVVLVATAQARQHDGLRLRIGFYLEHHSKKVSQMA